MHTTPESNQGPILWESRYAETEAALLPEPLREPYLWLKNYAAQECAKDVDLLVEAFKRVGVHRDKTTWTKLLKGRYNRKPDGTPSDNVLIKQETLLKEIEALRTDVRLEALQGKVPFVETTTWELISGFIDTRRDPMRVNKFGIVVGPTGSQKTACFKEYCRRHNHGCCVWLEAPENGSLSEFQTVLASKYNISRNKSWAEKRNAIFANVTDRNCIIVDNTQDLWRRDANSQQQAFGFLRRLQDEKRCTIILSITPTFERVLVDKMTDGYFEQFEGRAGGRRNFLRLQEYAPAEDVVLIAKKLGLKRASDHQKDLLAIAAKPGRIRHFFEVLQDAKLAAEADKADFTFAYVEAELGGEA